MNTDSTNAIQTIPSGCVHLVFQRGGRLFFTNGEMQPKNFIRGQLTRYGTLLPGGPIDMIAVIFHPLGIIPFVSFPLHLIYNQYVDIDSLEDAGLKNLQKTISEEKEASACIHHIENFLLHRFNKFNDYNYNRLYNTICSIKGQVEISVSSLADHACLGYRHFIREFYKYAGIDPKEYLRIIRFQRSLYTLQNNPGIDMGELAHNCGFYDNSHLVKEFKSMTGCSPTEYITSRIPHSTFFCDDSKLNHIKNSPA